MNIKNYTKSQAESRYKEQLVSEFSNIIVKNEYLGLRDEIIKAYEVAEKESKSYLIDLKFAIKLHNIFNSKNWFNEALASNYSFWKYISLEVMPDIIYKRHGDQRDYFYYKNVRLYPSTMYWFIHVFGLGSDDETYNFLSKKCFSTDTILQTVERPGRKGMNIELFKNILDKYSQLDIERIKKDFGAMNLFLRKILIQNTAKSVVLVPEFYNGGIVGYVDMLFESVLNGGSSNNG
jgi:hypothetical protein